VPFLGCAKNRESLIHLLKLMQLGHLVVLRYFKYVTTNQVKVGKEEI